MKKFILLVDNFDENFSNIYYDTLKNFEIYSINYNTHKQLLKKNIPHKIAEKFLDLNDRKGIDELAINATINWYQIKSFEKYLIYDSINLGSLLEQELFQYFVSIYNKSIISKKIIEILNPEKVGCYTEINDFIQEICKNKNIELIVYEKPKSQSLAFDQINIKYNLFNFPLSFKISRKQFLSLKNIFEKFLFSFFNFNSKPNKKKSILLAEFNPSQYNLFINELSKLDKNIILLNQRRSAIWNFNSFKIIKNSKCKILNLNTFEKKLKNIISVELNNFSTNLTKLWKFEKDFDDFFSIDSFSIWKTIRNDFQQTCSQRFLESVKRIILLNEFFKNYNIDVILEWAELGQEERELILTSKKFNVESIMLQHALDTSYSGWNRFHRFVLGGFSYQYISNKQALWGELPKKQALNYSTNSEEKILLSGSPRHDKFFLEEKKESKGIILLATTAVTGISQVESPFESYEKFNDFIYMVCEIVKKYPDKKLIVKTHPRSEYDNPITDLIKEIDSNITIIYDADLMKLINSSELVITFNNSTIALESLILEKPTISLQMEQWAESEDIVKMGAIVSISELDEIESNITKILHNQEFRDSLIKSGKIFVEQYLSYGGESSKILTKILNDY